MDSAQTEPMHFLISLCKNPGSTPVFAETSSFYSSAKGEYCANCFKRKNFISFRSNNIDKIIENDRELVESLSAELMERIKPFEYSLNA